MNVFWKEEEDGEWCRLWEVCKIVLLRVGVVVEREREEGGIWGDFEIGGLVG